MLYNKCLIFNNNKYNYFFEALNVFTLALKLEGVVRVVSARYDNINFNLKDKNIYNAVDLNENFESVFFLMLNLSLNFILPFLF